MGVTKGKSVVSSEITDELRAVLAKRAEAEERSISSVIARAIAFYATHAVIEKHRPRREEVAPLKLGSKS